MFGHGLRVGAHHADGGCPTFHAAEAVMAGPKRQEWIHGGFVPWDGDGFFEIHGGDDESATFEDAQGVELQLGEPWKVHAHGVFDEAAELVVADDGVGVLLDGKDGVGVVAAYHEPAWYWDEGSVDFFVDGAAGGFPVKVALFGFFPGGGSLLFDVAEAVPGWLVGCPAGFESVHRDTFLSLLFGCFLH